MSDETITRVLHDLKVIAAIRDNDKIFTQNGRLNLDHGGVISPIYRMAKGESRNRGVSAIENVISDAFAIAEIGFRKIEAMELKDNRESMMLKMKSYSLICKIRSNTSDCLIGLKNFRVTYDEDTSITARIDVLTEKVTQALKEVDAGLMSLKQIELIDVDDPSPRYGEFLIKEEHV